MTSRSTPLRLGLGRKRNLFAHVLDELGIRIVRGDFKPGEALPNEADLGREFGVSRSVVREAVKALAAKGLLESRTRMGIRALAAMHWNVLDVEVLAWRYSVMPPAQFFRELFEIRRMIEPEAAALAAERANESELAELADAYRAMVEASRADASGIEADLRFHRGILVASHNALLLQMGNLIGAGLLISHRVAKDSFALFLPLHKSVLDAIVEGDTAGARGAMGRLLSETQDFMRRNWQDTAAAVLRPA